MVGTIGEILNKKKHSKIVYQLYYVPAVYQVTLCLRTCGQKVEAEKRGGMTAVPLCVLVNFDKKDDMIDLP